MVSILVILQWTLAVVFVLAGIAKLFASKDKLKAKMDWVADFSKPAVKLIGLAEVVSAISLVLPIFIPSLNWIISMGAIIIGLLMLGAALTHLKRKESVVLPLVLLVLSAIVAYQTFEIMWLFIESMPLFFRSGLYVDLGIIGLVTTAYIYHKQREKKPLICNVVGGDCNAVINSKYAKTFGFENTLLGMVYYLAIIIYGLIGLLFSVAFLPTYFFWATLGATVFSIYLLFIQVFVLKNLCQYCIISAGVSIAIFLVTVLL